MYISTSITLDVRIVCSCVAVTLRLLSADAFDTTPLDDGSACIHAGKKEWPFAQYTYTSKIVLYLLMLLQSTPETPMTSD